MAKARPEVSDQAVRSATGRGWAQWLATLDRAGAAAMPRTEVVRLLADRYQLDGWWSQKVAVGYERSRGPRLTRQKADGYQVTVSKSVAADPRAVFDAIVQPDARRRWLGPQTLTLSRQTPARSLAGDWGDGSTLEVRLAPRDAGGCVVRFTHAGLPDAAAADAMKAFWRRHAELLKQHVEA